MDLNNPIPQEWTSYVTQSAVGLEVVPAHLYDVLTYTDNATRNLNFFQQTNVAESISNMKAAGMLPNPQSFLIQNIRIFFRTTLETVDAGAAGPLASLMNDVILLSNTGIAKLEIGTKKYGPWPMWTLPASTFAKGSLSQAGAEAANLTQGYMQLDGPLYPLFPNLMIAPLQNFALELAWPQAAVDLTANMVIQVLFDGQLARAVQ